jgi:hypothetical protein
MATLSAEIDYTNFKSEIEKHADQHDKLTSYPIIWSVMLKLQKLDRTKFTNSNTSVALPCTNSP